jgi:excisionase family DNA binding protein
MSHHAFRIENLPNKLPLIKGKQSDKRKRESCKLFLSVKEAAELMGCGHNHIRNLINNHGLPAKWFGGKISIARNDLFLFRDRCEDV